MKTLVFDFETRKSPNADMFKPEFKAPRITKDGKPHASDKTEEEQYQAWAEGCALNYRTAEICMMGYISTHDLEDDNPVIVTGTEREIIDAFWDLYASHDQYITSNGEEFDFPMVKVRSWTHRIKPLTHAFDKRIPNHIDIMKRFTSGVYGKMISVHDMALLCGLDPGTKDTDISERFGYYLQHEPELASSHCMNDVNLTLQIAKIIL